MTDRYGNTMSILDEMIVMKQQISNSTCIKAPKGKDSLKCMWPRPGRGTSLTKCNHVEPSNFTLYPKCGVVNSSKFGKINLDLTTFTVTYQFLP